MKTFKEFLSEAKPRFTVYDLDQGNSTAKFLEYLNFDELDNFMLKARYDALAVVSSKGQVVVYDRLGNDYKVNRKEYYKDSRIKYNKEPDLDK